MPTPYTQIRTSHALTIKAGGKVIGQIQSWAPSQSREVKPKFEINAVGTGAPVENVPGNASNLTLSISRYDLYLAKMEEIWGFQNPILMLTDQFNPIDVEESWIRYGSPAAYFPGALGRFQKEIDPENLLNKFGKTSVGKWAGVGNSAIDSSTVGTGYDKDGQPLEIYVEKLWYTGCWFTSLGRTLSATGDRIVNVNATLVYTKVRKLL